MKEIRGLQPEEEGWINPDNIIQVGDDFFVTSDTAVSPKEAAIYSVFIRCLDHNFIEGDIKKGRRYDEKPRKYCIEIVPCDCISTCEHEIMLGLFKSAPIKDSDDYDLEHSLWDIEAVDVEIPENLR